MKDRLLRAWQSLIRTSAFIRKEIFDVLRQPRLLFTLVLGPFLILLIFGIGYRNQARSLRTLFVVDQNSPLRVEIENWATTLGEQLIYAGVTSDQEAAIEQLRRGRVDLVAVTPTDAYETIRNNEQALFYLYHHEIDPLQVDYVSYFGQVYIDEVNRRVLLDITRQGQQEATDVQAEVQGARANAAALKQALQVGDMATARAQRSQLVNNVDAVSLAIGASMGLLQGVQQTVGTGEQQDSADILSSLANVRSNTEAVGSSGGTNGDTTATPADIQRVEEIETDLARLEEQLNEFTSINADVLVRPFRSEARSIATLQPEPVHFYAPAVIALLLQHLAVTFAALSIVRERSVGTMELFRVSPLSAGETLIGKYISYLLFGGILALILTVLLVFVLKVPMLGNWWYFALVVLTLLFTSLGIGFVISLVSQTDSQAVQYTMIVLLTSVFFSGFLMSLDMLWEPVHILSWSLPTTYGIVMLREIALRGNPMSLLMLGGLLAIGIALFVISWIMLRRMISTKVKNPV